jgi:hypothetical protein
VRGHVQGCHRYLLYLKAFGVFGGQGTVVAAEADRALTTLGANHCGDDVLVEIRVVVSRPVLFDVSAAFALIVCIEVPAVLVVDGFDFYVFLLIF